MVVGNHTCRLLENGFKVFTARFVENQYVMPRKTVNGTDMTGLVDNGCLHIPVSVKPGKKCGLLDLPDTAGFDSTNKEGVPYDGTSSSGRNTLVDVFGTRSIKLTVGGR
jgi:hypothetical protein